MVWSELSATVSRAMRDVPPPAMIVIHLGSNDIGTIKTFNLIENIETDILRFKLLFPNCRIIWSELLMTRYCHNAKKGTALEQARKRINCANKNFVLSEGHCENKHPNIRAGKKPYLGMTGSIYLTSVTTYFSTIFKRDQRPLYRLPIPARSQRHSLFFSACVCWGVGQGGFSECVQTLIYGGIWQDKGARSFP